ncbi:MAG TPA: class I adenylate-forming enzyme family protein [Mycobacteriales bacterium]|nr:class I adenylate-forming enzyme family protein [Mycobacteriales bacterium]HWA67914.1 class I adenylate-forming enzyme family protein [Mycobacteriales bacterium]
MTTDGLPDELADLPATIPAALARRLDTPDDDFVIGKDFRLSFGTADADSARLAGQLLAAGVGKGTRLGLLYANDPSWVTVWLAATRIGALTVPLSTFSPGPELARTVRHTDVAAIMTASTFGGESLIDRLELAFPALAESGPDLEIPDAPYLRWARVEDGAPIWSRQLPDPVSPTIVAAAEGAVAPADPLVVISTSGSTSAPKSVVHTHGSLIRHAALLARRRGLTCADRIYSPMPFFWVGGLTMVLLAALTSGAAALVQERFDPEEALELSERERATQISCWPNAALAMTKHPSFALRDLSSVRGGTLTAALPEMYRPPSADRAPMPLGMTETGGPHTSADDPYLPLPEHLRGTYGRTLPGFEHQVVEPNEIGVGELLVRGPLVMDSIYKKERHETFTADGWYRTGDLGSFDDEGYLRFTGRKTATIKSGGSNVAPGEVEAVLTAIDGVRECFVFGVPADERGEDVAAVVIVDAATQLDADKITVLARESLSGYKVPRQIKVTRSEALPLLPTGKVDMTAVRSWLAADAGE